MVSGSQPLLQGVTERRSSRPRLISQRVARGLEISQISRKEVTRGADGMGRANRVYLQRGCWYLVIGLQPISVTHTMSRQGEDGHTKTELDVGRGRRQQGEEARSSKAGVHVRNRWD
jgi:hypothetical protein